MRLGPKALVGLGLPAALRPHTPDKGVPATALRSAIDGQVLRSAITGQPLTSARTS